MRGIGMVAVVLLVWRGIRVVAAGDRLRPVAGQPCAAAASARRACVRRTRAKLPPRNGETLVTLAANDRSPRPSYFAGCSRLPGSLAPAVRCGAPEVRP